MVFETVSKLIHRASMELNFTDFIIIGTKRNIPLTGVVKPAEPAGDIITPHPLRRVVGRGVGILFILLLLLVLPLN